MKREKAVKLHTYVKKHSVSIGIISIKHLRKLHIADFFTSHHETHCFSKSLAVVYVVIAIQIQDIWRIPQNT